MRGTAIQKASQMRNSDNMNLANTARIITRFFFAAMLLLFASVSVRAQGVPIPYIPIQLLDNNGFPCSGCLLYTYAAGTSTPLATYADAAETTPNANPVVLDASGRATIFVGSSSYKFTLTLANGTQLWSVDSVNSSALSLLALNNVWTGTNTFNNTVTFNSTVTANGGFTSNGATNLLGGGSFGGTFTGNFTLSGVPTFQSGFADTVPNGTPPFTVLSSTQVANLNASQLEGCTWEVPCVLGSVTPNTVNATIANVNTNFVLNHSTAQTGVQGTDSHLLSAGAVSSTGAITAAVPHSGAAGTGFSVGDLLSVTGGGGTGGVIQVAAVTAGAPTSYSIVNQGSGYATTSAATLSVLTGSGTPGTADITSSSGAIGVLFCTDSQGGATTTGCVNPPGLSLSYNSQNLASNVSVSSHTQTQIDSYTLPALPTTCGTNKCRLRVTFGYYIAGGLEGACYVTDGTNLWGLSSSSTADNNFSTCASSGALSPNTYSSGATPTVSVYIVDGGAVTVCTALNGSAPCNQGSSPFFPAALKSSMQVEVVYRP